MQTDSSRFKQINNIYNNIMERSLENLYICPTVRAVQINGAEIICTSPGSRTEGYGINQYGLREDDWE